MSVEYTIRQVPDHIETSTLWYIQVEINNQNFFSLRFHLGVSEGSEGKGCGKKEGRLVLHLELGFIFLHNTKTL